MATIEIDAGKLWRRHILLRLAQLELDVKEIPLSGTQSTYVISYNTPRERKALNIFLSQLEETKKQHQAEQEYRKQWTKEYNDSVRLARINLVRRLTLREPLDKLPV